jgi:hypothetical protein
LCGHDACLCRWLGGPELPAEIAVAVVAPSQKFGDVRARRIVRGRYVNNHGNCLDSTLQAQRKRRATENQYRLAIMI